MILKIGFLVHPIKFVRLFSLGLTQELPGSHKVRDDDRGVDEDFTAYDEKDPDWDGPWESEIDI